MIRSVLLLLVPSVVGSRKAELERLLVRIERFRPRETAIERDELNRHAKAILSDFTNLAHLARVNVSVPPYNAAEVRVAMLGHLAATNLSANGASNRSRTTLRYYLLRAERSKPPPKRQPATARKKQGATIVTGKRLNWGGGGFTALGRCLGIALVPARVVYELVRLAIKAAMRDAAKRWHLEQLGATSRTLDLVMRRGPAKALPELYPALDLSRNGWTSLYYAHALDYTRTLRHVLRLAWRTPSDIGWWLATRSLAQVLGHWRLHERLEAALLRAATDEIVHLLRRLKATRRQRRHQRRRRRRRQRDET